MLTTARSRPGRRRSRFHQRFGFDPRETTDVPAVENGGSRIVQPGKTEQPFRHTEDLLQGAVKGGDNLLSKRRVEPGAAHLNDAQRRDRSSHSLARITIAPAPEPEQRG